MNHGEDSFSVFETMIAIGMLAVVLLQITTIQGQVVYSLEYSQKMSSGMWLAKGLMARVEYEWATRDFSEMDIKVKEKKVGDEFWGADASKAFKDFSYRITSEEWKLPILNFLTGGGASSQEPSVTGVSRAPDDGSSSLVSQQLEAIFGGHIMKVATVEVFWPEGARKGTASLSMLLVNQKALDLQILALKSPKAPPTKETKDQFKEKPKKPASQKTTPNDLPPPDPSDPQESSS